MEEMNGAEDMKTQDLRDLTLAIVTGERQDASQIEHNVAASYVRVLIDGSAEFLDALYANEDIYAVVKVVDGETHVLATDRSTFYAFDSNAGEPWIEADPLWLTRGVEALEDGDASVVTLAEAMALVPAADHRI